MNERVVKNPPMPGPGLTTMEQMKAQIAVGKLLQARNLAIMLKHKQTFPDRYTPDGRLK